MKESQVIQPLTQIGLKLTRLKTTANLGSQMTCA